jgi:hypothetical protein
VSPRARLGKVANRRMSALVRNQTLVLRWSSPSPSRYIDRSTRLLVEQQLRNDKLTSNG